MRSWLGVLCERGHADVEWQPLDHGLQLGLVAERAESGRPAVHHLGEPAVRPARWPRPRGCGERRSSRPHRSAPSPIRHVVVHDEALARLVAEIPDRHARERRILDRARAAARAPSRPGRAACSSAAARHRAEARPERPSRPLRPRPRRECSRRSPASSCGVPWRAMRPSAISITRSAVRASAGEWVIMIAVRPRISASRPSITAASLSASRPVVGSSSTRIGGLRRIVRAIAIR